MISVLLDGDRRLESQKEICNHVLAFYKDLFTKEDCDCPSLDKLEFSMIDEADADLIEKQFNKAEVKAAVFDLGGEKAPRPDGFPLSFFQIFWENIKEDVMNFMNEFHERGKLSKHIGASFITLIAKKAGATNIRDFRPISLIGVMYKVSTKVLATIIQKLLPKLISVAQGAFVHGRQILDGVLIANECIHSRYKE